MSNGGFTSVWHLVQSRAAKPSAAAPRSGGMNAMATGASDVRLGMRRRSKFAGHQRGNLRQAASTSFVQLGNLVYLGDVAAALNVGPPWPVAALAGCAGAMLQGKLLVRVVAELFDKIGMAGCADVEPI